MKWIKRIFLTLGTLFFVFVVGKYSIEQLGIGQGTTVKVGIMSGDERIWKPIAKRLKKESINLKLVIFNNYDQPNTALKNGDIDLNAFQHNYFLDNWNKSHKTDLVAIGDTIIGPMAIFSDKIKNIKNLPNGAVVTMPNDATNQARALKMLAGLGLITLKSVEFPTPNDVINNPKDLKIEPLDASQTARSLGDATIAIVNNSVALDAGLKYKNAIYLEPITKDSTPWINIIASRAADKNNKTYQKIVAAYQSPETKAVIKKLYDGSTFPAWDIDLGGQK